MIIRPSSLGLRDSLLPCWRATAAPKTYCWPCRVADPSGLGRAAHGAGQEARLGPLVLVGASGAVPVRRLDGSGWGGALRRGLLRERRRLRRRRGLRSGEHACERLLLGTIGRCCRRGCSRRRRRAVGARACRAMGGLCWGDPWPPRRSACIPTLGTLPACVRRARAARAPQSAQPRGKRVGSGRRDDVTGVHLWRGACLARGGGGWGGLQGGAGAALVLLRGRARSVRGAVGAGAGGEAEAGAAGDEMGGVSRGGSHRHGHERRAARAGPAAAGELEKDGRPARERLRVEDAAREAKEGQELNGRCRSPKRWMGAAGRKASRSLAGFAAAPSLA